jgi:hypothetical protein
MPILYSKHAIILDRQFHNDVLFKVIMEHASILLMTEALMIQSLLPFLDILVRCTGPLKNCINYKLNLVL